MNSITLRISRQNSRFLAQHFLFTSVAPLCAVSLLFLFLVSCGDDKSNGTADLWLTEIAEEPAGENCPEGGQKIMTGLDANGDGVLQEEEVSDSSYVCHGVSADAILFRLDPEPAGQNCPHGGQALNWGIDENENDELDPDEVTETQYVCNGSPGSGTNSLANVTEEEPGENCANGGQAIRVGLDANEDGLLQPDEVDSVSYVCNGTAGANSLVRQEDEPVGANCTYGGRVVLSGIDLDGDNYLDENEVETTAYVCNGEPGEPGDPGEPGVNSVYEVTDEPAGAHCPAGGVLVQSGLDTNGNGVLDDPEVQANEYVCHGTNGTDGTDGTDGTETLVEVSQEPVGSNCPTGGQKIESGLDSDADGVLDPGEITSTSYVCDGEGLLIEAENAQWGGVCLRGGVKIETGVDHNADGVLDPSEVERTEYVCNVFPVQIDSGKGHTCAVMSDGSARCWGRNDSGRLGDGTTVERYTPVAVSGLNKVAAISAGGAHTCALLFDGTVRCWGSNAGGQLGDGTTTDKSTAVFVSGVSNAVSISAGYAHTCAVLSDATARCWGENDYGQLGDGTTTDRHTPTSVSGLGDADSISTGAEHTCTLTSSGSVRCWGRNNHGQLGDGTVTDRLIPVLVSGLNDGDSLSAGSRHTCAIISDGTARCWGDNAFGRLGDGTTTDRHTPVAVSGLSNVASISAGGLHTCAVLYNYTGKCWGMNNHGQLGDGSTTVRVAPVSVSGLHDATLISAGAAQTCTVHSGGLARCWGWNAYGQLGDDTTTNRHTPTLVLFDLAL